MTRITRPFVLASLRAVAAGGAGAALAATAATTRRETAGAEGRRRAAGERFARRLDRLGGAYLKAGQLLSTRVDLLPEEIRTPMRRLCDEATPPERRDHVRLLREALGPESTRALADLNPVPLATGSVTHVYRARRVDNGTPVVVKVLRPDAPQFTSDLMLIRLGARLTARVPALRSVPVVDAAGVLTAAIAGHLDLPAEAAHQARLAQDLSEITGLLIPAVHHDLCTPGALVMDYVPGVRIDAPHRDGAVVADAAMSVLRGLYVMLFEHGLVHCDLHPGNILVTEAGDAAMIDFGYVAQLTGKQRQEFAKLFVAMALDDPEGVTDVIVGTAQSLPRRLDRPRLTDELAVHLAGTTAASAADFNVARFVAGLFAIQHRHRIIAATDFVMGIVALITLEGILKQVTPQLDFQREALPYVLNRLGSAAVE